MRRLLALRRGSRRLGLTARAASTWNSCREISCKVTYSRCCGSSMPQRVPPLRMRTLCCGGDVLLAPQNSDSSTELTGATMRYLRVSSCPSAPGTAKGRAPEPQTRLTLRACHFYPIPGWRWTIRGPCLLIVFKTPIIVVLCANWVARPRGKTGNAGKRRLLASYERDGDEN